MALVPDVAWSDHLSFRRKRCRAMIITDTAFYRYPCYHTPHKLNHDEFARMLNGLFPALRVLVDAPCEHSSVPPRACSHLHDHRTVCNQENRALI